MTKYILQTSELPDRVLYVRQWHNGLWHVCQLPVDPRRRHYPNYDYDSGRLFYCDTLAPSRTAEEMQAKLDKFAKNTRTVGLGRGDKKCRPLRAA